MIGIIALLSFVSGIYFGIRALILLFRILSGSPRAHSLIEQFERGVAAPTTNKQFMRYVFLCMGCFLGGLALLSFTVK